MGGVGRVLCAVSLLCVIAPAKAGSLTVSPITLSVPAPGGTTTLSVSGGGEGSTAGQVRVMRWLQTDGAERLVPTRDVVASPPALKLEPGRDLTVRLVRTAQRPVIGEECYRVLVDQLPGAEQDQIAVKFAIRHSIPLCFDADRQKQGTVTWNLRREGNALVLRARNNGERRAVAKDVVITAPKGTTVRLGSAVVLGGSTMSRLLLGKLKGFAPGASFSLKANIGGKDIIFTGKISGG